MFYRGLQKKKKKKWLNMYLEDPGKLEGRCPGKWGHWMAKHKLLKINGNDAKSVVCIARKIFWSVKAVAGLTTCFLPPSPKKLCVLHYIFSVVKKVKIKIFLLS